MNVALCGRIFTAPRLGGISPGFDGKSPFTLSPTTPSDFCLRLRPGQSFVPFTLLSLPSFARSFARFVVLCVAYLQSIHYFYSHHRRFAHYLIDV